MGIPELFIVRVYKNTDRNKNTREKHLFKVFSTYNGGTTYYHREG